MSLHADAVGLLGDWTAPDAAQETLRTEFLGYLSGHDDAMWIRSAPAHLTASALVIDPYERRAVLVLHAKINIWVPAGGHCEPDDATLGAAALREATEETGIEGLTLLDAHRPASLDKHPAPCRRGVVDHHFDVQFLAVAPPGAVPAVSEESHDVAWFDYADLPSPLGEDVPALVARAAALPRRGIGGSALASEQPAR